MQEFDRDLLVHALRTSVVRLEFTKKSGEYRVMKATLKEDMIPSEHQLQMVRAVGEETFQPKIEFKTRYGMVANPFATSRGTGQVGTSGEVRPVYDLDNMGWRSFRWDSLKSWADWIDNHYSGS